MLSSVEKEILSYISSSEGWPLVERFARTRRELPEEFEIGAADLAGRLEALGLPVTLHRPSIYLGIPRTASLVCEGRSFECKATALSPTQAAITARLVHIPARDGASRVHSNDPAVLFGDGVTRESLRDRIKDAVVITEGLSNPGRSELFQALGALASITVNPGEAVHWGASSVVWGSPRLEDLERLPTMVSLAVNKADGAKLIAAALRNVQVTLSADVLHGWFDQTLPVVEIKAADASSDQFVLLHGHLDSWDLGVGDNATGNAVLLETARALHAGRAHLKRNVRIAWWPGHSAGRYAGSTWYADQFAHQFRDSCVAHLNCDSPGCKDATDYSSIRGMAEAEGLVSDAVSDLFNQKTTLERPGRAGDYSFNNLGVTGALLTSSMVPPEERRRRGWYSVGGNGGSPTWHTEADVLEVADRHVLENDARLYTLVAARLAAVDIPALDFRRPLAQLHNRIESAADACGGAVNLHIHQDLVEKLEDCVAGCYVPGTDRPSSYAVWEKLFNASRAIVRAGYAEGGTFEQDPAYAQLAVPMLAAAAQAVSQPAARVSLQRGANLLRAELELALAKVQG